LKNSDNDGQSLDYSTTNELLSADVWFPETNASDTTPDKTLVTTDAIPSLPVDDSVEQETLTDNDNRDRENCNSDTTDVHTEADPSSNSGPNAQDDSHSTFQDVAVSGSVAGNDNDSAGDTLMYFVKQGPAHGSIDFNQNGSYTYTPALGFSGQDTFTYEANEANDGNDGNGGTDIATVTIDIAPSPNQNPDAIQDVNATDYNTSVSGRVLCNDVDPDGDALSVSMNSDPANGAVSVTPNGHYTYTPNEGFSGQDSFKYTVSNGKGGCDTATVTITVGCVPEPPPVVNDTPVASDDVNYRDYETTVSGNVLPNDSDSDGDAPTTTLLQATTEGTVILNTDGSYLYTPNDGFSGQNTFGYQVDDSNGGSDTATVNVDAVPNTISASDDAYSTNFNDDFSGNVLDNDVDPDGDALAATEMTDVRTSEGGTVTLYADGSFVFTPALDFFGVDSFVYESADGNGNVTTANVTITVSDAQELPVDDNYTSQSNSAIKGNVVLNDSIADEDVRVVLVEGPANGTLQLNSDGTFCYQANDGFSGDDTFSYSLVRGCPVSQAAEVKLVLAEVQYDTTYIGSGQDGLIWGDPHFRGDDGGLFDVQGEADHVYNLLSDHNLQVNAKFVYWNGIESDGTVIGELGATVGQDRLHVGADETTLNGNTLAVGSSIAIDGGTLEFDGTVTTLITGEYQFQFIKQDGLFSVRIKVINPFSDLVAPHGLWGQTIDGDTVARTGDFYKENYDYGLQGGGALDSVDAGGSIVRTEQGDQTSYQLYETADLFSTQALYADGEIFFRYDAAQGTGLATL